MTMDKQAARWWSESTEDTRRIVLAEWGIRPGTRNGRECFSYGLVNVNLPVFAQRVVESAFRTRELFDPFVR